MKRNPKEKDTFQEWPKTQLRNQNICHPRLDAFFDVPLNKSRPSSLPLHIHHTCDAMRKEPINLSSHGPHTDPIQRKSYTI